MSESMGSKLLLALEEGEQRAVATSDVWLLAKRMNVNFFGDGDDTKEALKALGFRVAESGDELFYAVIQPAGWTRKNDGGFWTYVYDAEGNERISQFYKGAFYDRRAHLQIREV